MLVKVRYRRGIVRESLRVVHLAEQIEDGRFRTVCGQVLDAAAVEQDGGMPCQPCLLGASLNHVDEAS